ncbi:hypothetical protein EI94DRAFT_1701160 [Lactarius quietus]|nr:hypothetical protein EI94DRAFT_1701160 [Lactarius quietus]
MPQGTGFVPPWIRVGDGYKGNIYPQLLLFMILLNHILQVRPVSALPTVLLLLVIIITIVVVWPIVVVVAVVVQVSSSWSNVMVVAVVLSPLQNALWSFKFVVHVRDATVWFGPVWRPFSPNPKLDLGPVQAQRLNPEPHWGLVWSGPVQVIFHPGPWTGP